jgi:hypothetical protein
LRPRLEALRCGGDDLVADLRRLVRSRSPGHVRFRRR